MRRIPFEYAVRNLGRSTVRCAGGIIGSGLVVLLVLTAGSFVRGMVRSLSVTGLPDNVILLGAGSEESIERSEIDAAVPGIVAAAVEGIRTRLGQPLVSEESHVQVEVRATADASHSFPANLRGVTPPALLVHRQVRLIEGRLPQAGSQEMMSGRMAAARLGLSDPQLAVGRQLWIDGRPWTIVGRFEAPGSVIESELWCPLSDIQIMMKRTTYSCVVLTLGDAEFADVDAFCKQRLDLELVAIRESDYYARLAEFFAPIRAMVWATAGLIALGGLLGGLNTLYAAFASRVRELATLQTIGFSRRAILLTLVQEAGLLACAGALLASLAAIMVIDGVAVRYSMGVFALTVDETALAIGLAAGLLLGLCGALPPAWRCLRLPINEALKAA
jgi:putative ABC transport system permease protein